ncbi:diguanylate cyclase [Eubacterium sp. 1001713B170207_170306_E7]|uniref:diguanylate cyclase n=1 Tax=Eubacterium sp. 1001713B170207_170306_E7 TaxID=2787097 RepID=UPI001A9AF3BB|nr:diguanylate cyclase [Eubacterium sp. 1001713B170207_170306_E7]
MDIQPEKRKILIVDDMELNRALLCEMFQTKYTIYEAENGAQALEILEREGEDIAVVLLDLIMPVLDGFGVLAEMERTSLAGRVPVIMITAENSEGVMQHGYEMGAADIVTKPFNPNIVIQRVHNIIEQYTQKLHLRQLVAEQTKALREQAEKMRENSAQMIDTLSSIIEFKNTESVSHIHNVRVITRLLLAEFAKNHSEYGLSDALIEMISEAAAMHDIGKVAIPDNILNKPGRLTDEEFEVMKTHTSRGSEILMELSGVQDLAYYDYCYDICRHHHERWDGGGYPDGLAGNEISIWAQAVSLADVYDALTSKRVYKDAYTHETAVQMILDGECGVFNPQLIDCFLAALPELNRSMKGGEMLASTVTAPGEVTIPEKKKKENHSDLSSRTLYLLEQERQKYQILSDLSDELIFEYDLKTDKLVFSDRFQILTGKSPVFPQISKIMADESVVNSEDRKRLFKMLEHITPDKPKCKAELRINLDGGGFQWHQVYLYPIWDMEFEPVCVSYIGKLINVEESKQRNLLLKREAESDPLTGLLNQKAMREQSILVLKDRRVCNAALCFADVDNFKAVNDERGHLFGDMVLKEVAEVITSSVRHTDLVGRVGGDEFLILFHDIIDQRDIERRVAAISKKLNERFDNYGITGSLGISRYPQDGEDFDTLLQKADQALYHSKDLGKNQYKVYDVSCANRPFRSSLTRVDNYNEKIEEMARELKNITSS